MRSESSRSDGQFDDRHRMWSRAVLLKYWAMQLPSLLIVLVIMVALVQNLGWPGWVVWVALTAWVVKDALLYWLVWRAYDPDCPVAFPYRMEGATGVAIDHIEHEGTVRIWGELWHAKLSPHARRLSPGQRVRVKARHGLTLVVEAAER